jgi:RNA polymerase sigma factor (sigma-70 family)
MAGTQLHSFISRLRRVVQPEEQGGLTDAQLLERFVGTRDEAAFEVLVWRHGLLVLNVCRRLLREEHEVEDAFQATFLVLVRKAGSIGKREALAGWLYRVAYRIALAARAGSARRVLREKQCLDERDTASATDPTDEAIRAELRPIIDAAVNSLPAKYRLPVILCYLEGKTYEEAARQLGWPKGTLSIRLSRGRDILRKRLARHVAVLPASGLTTYLTPGAAPAAVPPNWVKAAIQNSSRPSAGQMPGTLSGRATVLAERVMRAMAVARLKMAACLMLAVGILAAGVGLATFQAPAERPPETAGQEERPKPPREKAERKDAFGDPLPSGALARLGTIRFRQTQNVSDIAYSPDGKILAGVDTDMVCLWDTATGKELRRLKGGTLGHGLAFSHDGKILATATGRTIFYWDPVTGKQLRQLSVPGPGGPIHSLVFSPDGKTLAGRTQDNTVRLSEAATGKVLHEWPGPPNVMPSSVSFSPDSRTLAIACQNENDIHLYDTTTGKEVHRLIGPPKGQYVQSAYCVAFSPSGKTLVSSARDNILRFWNADTGKEIRQVKHASFSFAPKLAFSPDGAILATGGENVDLREAATGKLLRVCERDDDGHIESLIFSPDGKTVAAARSNSQALSLWDVASGKKHLVFAGHLRLVAGVAVSPDGKLLASAAWEKNYTRRNTVHLWDPATGKEVGTVGSDLGFVGGLAFSPDGRLLAAGNEDGTIRIWERATRKEMRWLTGHKQMVEWIDFTADGKVLASLGYHDRLLRLWDVATGKQLRQFAGSQPHPYGGIALAPDGKSIAQGGEEKPSLVLWDTATGKTQNLFRDYVRPVSGVALSPDGKMLASAERGGGIQLWELPSGKALRWLPDPNFWINLLFFSPDSRTLASGGRDHIIRLWEVATGAERCQFVGHSAAIRSGAFSPDGRKFYSGSEDTTVLIWDVTGRVSEDRPQFVKLSRRELEDLRTDLAAADGHRAYRALWTLVAAQDQAVALFRDQPRPVSAADPQRVAKLLADLDSNAFDVREKATKELQKMGETSLSPLHKALASPPSLEVRHRIEQLLETLDDSPTEQIYKVRAVEVLEQIGSPEARRLLESLASGVPEARLTREAKASLQRLTHKPAVVP